MATILGYVRTDRWDLDHLVAERGGVIADQRV
jgi:hypothetical protein